jgi:hypothetical protein
MRDRLLNGCYHKERSDEAILCAVDKLKPENPFGVFRQE